MRERNVVIVGGGPLCTYGLERLAAHSTKTMSFHTLCISIFERSDRFGAGEVHSELQASTSYMNRVVGQIGFAADESNLAASELLPQSRRHALLI